MEVFFFKRKLNLTSFSEVRVLAATARAAMKFLIRSLPRPNHYHHQNRRSFGDATIERVRDRGLEHAVEKERSLKPMLNIKNLIKAEPSKSLPISIITQNKDALGLWTRPIDFIRRFPSIFEEFHPGGIGIHPHVRLTPELLSLDGDELSIFQTESYRKQAADRLLKLLMLSRINKIPLSIVDRLKWDLGLPQDYVETLVPEFPDYFQVRGGEGQFSGSRGMVLELVCWSKELAVSVMEKNAMAGGGGFDKGMSIEFPSHFSKGFELDKKLKKWLDEWQKLPYVSPYENASHLPPKSDESDKWVVGLLHEFLHLLVPKKTDKENILCLGEYMGLRSRFKRALVNHPGIFYLSTKTGMHTVLLKEAYKRDLLIEKHPLMDMRYQYIHLMNTVKEDHKPICASRTSAKKKEQKDTSDASREKSEQVEDEESSEEFEGELRNDVEEDTDDDYEDEDEDEDDDKIETQRVGRQNVAANRRTTRKANFDTRGGPLRNPLRERSRGRYSDVKEGERYPGSRDSERSRGRYSDVKEGERYPGSRDSERSRGRYPSARGQRYPDSRDSERSKGRYPNAREGQRYPDSGDSERSRGRYPNASEGQRYPDSGDSERSRGRYPNASEGQRYPGSRDSERSRGRYPNASEGQRYRGSRDSERSRGRYPNASEGQRYPGSRDSERSRGRYPNASEGQRYPGSREGLRTAKREGNLSPKVSRRKESYNGDKVHFQSSDKSNFPRSRGRSLTDKKASFQ